MLQLVVHISLQRVLRAPGDWAVLASPNRDWETPRKAEQEPTGCAALPGEHCGGKKLIEEIQEEKEKHW